MVQPLRNYNLLAVFLEVEGNHRLALNRGSFVWPRTSFIFSAGSLSHTRSDLTAKTSLRCISSVSLQTSKVTLDANGGELGLVRFPRNR